MSIVLIILVALIVLNLKVSGENKEYIGRQQTYAINGIFIILVFLRHFNQYVTLEGILDTPFLYINSMLGQLIVTTFMFYSGYGVMYSILEKGIAYINGIPKNRILKTMLLFDVAILFYILLNLILKVEMTMPQIILSFIGWTGVGNSTWYIFAILIMYFLTYVAFKISNIFDHKKMVGLIITTVLIIGYVFVVREFKDSQYYNTVLCYAMGLWYAYFKSKIDILLKKRSVYYIILILATVAFIVSYLVKDINLIINQLYYLLFVVTIVLISMKVKIYNSVLIWCGKNLLGLYILQRIPMIALQRSSWMLTHPYVYFLLCVIITIGLTVAYRYIVIDKIEGLFKKKK